MIRKIFIEVANLVLNFFNFCCMFFLLGVQALLQGSWRVSDVENNKEMK